MLLNCETTESTLASLASIYKASPSILTKVIKDFSYDDTREGGLDDQICPYIENKFESANIIDKVRIFHAGRYLSDKPLVRLKPLTDELFEKITSELYTLISDIISVKDWNTFIRESVKTSTRITCKFTRSERGPFGYLFYRCAKDSHIAENGPEIISTTYNIYSEIFGNNTLAQRYLKKSKPRVYILETELENSENSQKSILKEVLAYCWAEMHDEQWSCGYGLPAKEGYSLVEFQGLP